MAKATANPGGNLTAAPVRVGFGSGVNKDGLRDMASAEGSG